MIAIVLSGTLWFGIEQYKSLQKERKAKHFIEQIIKSVRADTEFYKMKTESDIMGKVESSHNFLSHSYVISTIDYSWDIYEGTVLFDDGVSIKVDVTFRNNEPYMLHNWHLTNNAQ